MDDRKAKKTVDGQSKSPRAFQPRLEQLKKHESSRSKSKVTHERSHTRERRRSRREESPPYYHQQSPADRRQHLSSSQYESGYKTKRHHSQSPSLNDSRQRIDTTVPEEKPSRVLGVFGLSMYTDERVLKEVFTQYGPVEDIHVILDHHSRISRGFAFVYMKHLQDAIQAKELTPGTEIDGRKIRVDYSVTDFSPYANPGGGVERPPVHSRPFQNLPDLYHPSARRSPPTSHTRDHLYGNGLRYCRDRSRSYSPRHF